MAVPPAVKVSFFPCADTTLIGLDMVIIGPPASRKSFTPLSSLSYPVVTP